MDDQFDNELKNRISQMFENFEHKSVDKGWQQLQAKLPETEKNRGVKWLWAILAAAVLFVFFSIGIIISHQNGKTKVLSQKSINHYDHENEIKAHNKQSVDTLSPLSHTGFVKGLGAETISPKTNRKIVVKNQLSKNQVPSQKGKNTFVEKKQPIKQGPAKTQIVKSDNKESLSSLNKNHDVTTAQPINTTENVASVTHTDTSKIISDDEIVTSSVTNENVGAKTQSLKAFQSRLAKPREIGGKNRKKIAFSIYAATYDSYAQGSGINLNAGAGVTADIRLFKHLKLTTGLAIEQNTLNYGSKLPNLNSVINTGVTLAFNLLTQTSSVTNSVTYSLVLKNYTAQLVGFDVPLNLKYEFNSQKNDRYFSMGLSSGVFIHQSYTYQYNYSSLSLQTSAVSNGLHDGLNSFYFAKTLNVAFGLSYPVGKTNSLTIEPFLKYPLTGLGSEGIRFGTSGINLKFGFHTTGK